jgi:hypothetical protein
VAGDAPCPNCGTWLWFVGFSDENRLFFESCSSKGIRKRCLEFLMSRLGVSEQDLEANTAHLGDLGFDSLDLVELMMELEEELKRPG